MAITNVVSLLLLPSLVNVAGISEGIAERKFCTKRIILRSTLVTAGTNKAQSAVIANTTAHISIIMYSFLVLIAENFLLYKSTDNVAYHNM